MDRIYIHAIAGEHTHSTDGTRLSKNGARRRDADAKDRHGGFATPGYCRFECPYVTDCSDSAGVFRHNISSPINRYGSYCTNEYSYYDECDLEPIGVIPLSTISELGFICF